MRLGFAALLLLALGFAAPAVAADVARSYGRPDRAAPRAVERRVVVYDGDCAGTLLEEVLDTPPIFRRPPPVAFTRWYAMQRREIRRYDGVYYVRDPRSAYGSSGHLRFPGNARRHLKCEGW